MAKQKPVNTPASARKKAPGAPASNPRNIMGPYFYGLVIFFFSIVIYANSIGNNYCMDDELVTANNTDPNAIHEHPFTSKGWKVVMPDFSAFGSAQLKDSSFVVKLKYFLPEVFRKPYYEDPHYSYEYRPLVLASFAIEHALFGDNPHTSHFINVLLYGLMCLLLFNVLKRLVKKYNVLLPFFITLVFAAHPIHTEVVASIKNRDEMLAFIFGLLSLWAAISFNEKKRFGIWLLIPFCFLMGILAKSTTITFAFLIPLTLIVLSDITLTTVILITIPLSVFMVLFARLYSVSQQILLLTGLFTAVILLYYIKNAPNIYKNIKAAFASAHNALLKHTEPEIKAEHPLNFTFLKNPLVSTAFLLVVLIPVAAGAAGIYMGWVWLSCIPLLVLSIIFLMVRVELQALLITPISLLAVGAVVRFHASSTLIDAGLLVFLATQLLSTNKTVKIIAAVNFMVYALVAALAVHSFFFISVLFFAGFINRKLLPVTIGLLVLSIAIFVKNLWGIFSGSMHFNFTFLNLPWIYIGFFLLYRNKSHLLSRVAVLSLPLFVFMYFETSTISVNSVVKAVIVRTVAQLNTTKAADPIPVQFRPLKYVEFPISNRDSLLGTSMIVLGKYLKQSFIPYPMSYYYGYAAIVPTSYKSFGAILVFIVYFFLGLLSIFYIRKVPLLSFAIMFYLASVVVFSNLFIPVPGLMADRFLLIPSLGFSFFVVFALQQLFKIDFTGRPLPLASLKKPFLLSLGGLLLIYSFLTIARNMDWKDRLTLFKHDIYAVENSAQAQNLLGLHLLIQANSMQDVQEQIKTRLEGTEHLKKAVEIWPDFLNASFDMSKGYEGLSADYAAINDIQKAKEYVNLAYDNYMYVLKLDSNFVNHSYDLAVRLQSMDDSADIARSAILYEKYLTKYKASKEPYINLSYAYFKLNQFDKSIQTNHRLLAVQPNSYEALINLGKTFYQIGPRDSALVYFEKSFEVNNTDKGVAQLLIQLNIELGHKDKAMYYQDIVNKMK